MRGGKTAPSSSPCIITTRADEPRRHSPARRPAEFLFAFAVLKLDAACSREILAEKMRRASLDRLPVLHHRFDRKRLHRAGKFFAFRFFTGEHRDREVLADKALVNARGLTWILPEPPPRSHGRCVLPAREIRSCAKTDAAAFPSGQRSPID